MTTLVRFQGSTGPEIGLLSEGHVVPSGLGDSDWGPLLAAWALEGADVPAAGPPLPEDRMALLPPLTDCSRVFGVAQNYPAHAAEAGGDSPPTPIVFLKPASAFVGHNATASLPSSSAFYDYEAEVAVIIGRSARGVSAHDAVGVVAGYSIGNDGSARDLQPATLANRFQVDWFAAKSFDAGSALGPGIVRASTLPDSASLRIKAFHNGQAVQDDVTGSMFHSIPDLVAFLSRIVSLRAGDVILTGTPAGVGKARGVPLAHGDVVRVTVPGVGELRTRYSAGADGADASPSLPLAHPSH